MKTWEEIQAQLKEPFPEEDIEWRIGQCGKKRAGGGHWAKALAYITSRAIMNRLDDVVGCGNWWNTFSPGPDGGVLCGIAIRVGDDVVTKYDGAENTHVEAVKGGLSDSMKRAAVQWGMGRYLYWLEEGWCECSDSSAKGWRFQPADKNGKWDQFYWLPPPLPGWAVPGGHDRKPAAKAEKPKGNKYKDSDPTPAESIITGIRDCTDIEELNAFYKKHKQTINDSPRKDEILTEFSVRKGELEAKP